MIGGQIYPSIEERETDKLSGREKLSGKIDSSFEHYVTWDFELAKKFKGADFATYPRGRVMFDTQDRHHIVYADECITGETVEQIEVLFQTISAKVCRDEHYACDKCMKKINKKGVR